MSSGAGDFVQAHSANRSGLLRDDAATGAARARAEQALQGHGGVLPGFHGVIAARHAHRSARPVDPRLSSSSAQSLSTAFCTAAIRSSTLLGVRSVEGRGLAHVWRCSGMGTSNSGRCQGLSAGDGDWPRKHWLTAAQAFFALSHCACQRAGGAAARLRAALLLDLFIGLGLRHQPEAAAALRA